MAGRNPTRGKAPRRQATRPEAYNINITDKSQYQVCKPQLERRRRARINENLAQLKLLIMDDLRDQPGRISRLDKSEILELAVNHLKYTDLAPPTARTSERAAVGAGMNDCLWVAHRIMAADPTIPPEVRIRFLDDMAAWVHSNDENLTVRTPDDNSWATTPEGVFTNGNVINEDEFDRKCDSTSAQRPLKGQTSPRPR